MSSSTKFAITGMGIFIVALLLVVVLVIYAPVVLVIFLLVLGFASGFSMLWLFHKLWIENKKI